MTWREAAASLQLLAEERYGSPTRARVLAAVAEEDVAAAKAREALKP
jgi:hypothetical protein